MINQATDREINKALADKEGLAWHHNNGDGWEYSDSFDYSKAVDLPDYCNDWGAIGELIEKYKEARITELNVSFFHYWQNLMDKGVSIKRAAAICILMMED